MDAEAYEIQRQANIAENLALLRSLGLSGASSSKTSTRQKRPASDKEKVIPAKKRNAPSTIIQQPVSASDPVRRSGRARKPATYYTAEIPDGVTLVRERKPRLAKEVPFIEEDDYSDEEGDEADYVNRSVRNTDFSPRVMPQRRAQKLGVRVISPKMFGHIPFVPVGTWWATRMDCSTDAVHAPTVAGISGTVEDGCYSLALSGGYADDIDLGDRFTYTGSGGRKLQGMVNGKRLNLRTAPQTFDQSFEDRCNAALLTSSKTGNPIRVIRGYKGDSIWAPSSGYLYSGLYVCTRAWLADGLSGYKVCRYAFKRLPDQDPLPIADQSSDSTSIASSPAPSRQPLTPRCNHTNCRVEVVIMVDKQKKSS